MAPCCAHVTLLGPQPSSPNLSHWTRCSCQYHADDSLVLVDARAIEPVIVMISFMERPEGGRPRRHNGRFLVVEKPVLSWAELGVEEWLELPQD